MKRNFYPGEKWLFYKIYCNKQISNKILLDPIDNITKDLIDRNIINKWFFVRYSDPDSHLRIRFCLNKEDDVLLVINYLKSNLVEYLNEHKIWKLQIDTYKPEIERYGGECIKSAEAIFFYDSLLVIDLLKYNLDNEFLIIAGIKYINECLVSFKINDTEKFIFINSLKDIFHKEYGINLADKKKLNKKYKLLENKIKEALINSENSSNNNFNELFNRRAKRVAFEVDFIKESKIENHHNILGSLIHMGINRLFFENQRFYEMICYDYLTKFYNSKKWLNI